MSNEDDFCIVCHGYFNDPGDPEYGKPIITLPCPKKHKYHKSVTLNYGFLKQTNKVHICVQGVKYHY
jgi:hypothetical protein